MRSLAVNVSNAKFIGAIRSVTKSRGTASAEALPASEKSVSRTVIFFFRLEVEQLLMERERVLERAADVRDDEGLGRLM